jgi:predicted phage terminase large subunit-like protein
VSAVVSELDGFSDNELRILNARLAWRKKARIKQLPPDQWPLEFKYQGRNGPRDWLTWGMRSGRGFGKTRAGAEWLWPEAVDDPGSFNFVIAPTYSDVRYTCFEGDSGLINCIPPELILDYNKTDVILTLWTGAKPSQIRGFSADTPERLRGPQSHRAWLDEIAAWRYPQATWDMLMFGLRLGKKPRIAWTSTLKPKAFISQLVSDKSKMTVIVQGSTYDNAKNLAPQFLDQLLKYKGTALGRQELEGELLDPTEAGIVKRSQFRLWPAKKQLPMFDFVIYSLDTAFTEDTFDKKEIKADPSACSVWGIFTDKDTLQHAMLLDAWDEHLGFPALIDRVKKESRFHYGSSTRMAGEGTYLRPARVIAGSGRTPDLIIIEDKGSGISLRQTLEREQILTWPYNPGRADKLTRLHAVTPMFAHGRVWCIESESIPNQPKTWAEPLIMQICTYMGPGSTDHDDYVDSTSQALRYIIDSLRISFTKPARLARPEDKAPPKQKGNPYDR